jgi:hypothetical protein
MRAPSRAWSAAMDGEPHQNHSPEWTAKVRQLAVHRQIANCGRLVRRIVARFSAGQGGGGGIELREFVCRFCVLCWL